MDRKRLLLNKTSNTFGVNRVNKSVPSFSKITKSIVPEIQQPVNPTVESSIIILKTNEFAILKTSVSDPDNLRTIKLDKKCNIEYIDAITTKITALEDINDRITIILPSNQTTVDLNIEYGIKTGMYTIPIDLANDYPDISITSLIIDDKEIINESIKWEVLNLYMDNEFKYDYCEMFNKAFKDTTITTYLINKTTQQFIWRDNVKWKLKFGNYEINSSDLSDIKEVENVSKIIEWDNVDGIWESLWVRFDGEKKVKEYKGTWCEVIEQLIKEKEWEYFYGGIIYNEPFTFCLRKDNINYVFTNL